jgi:hypothetical protein
VGQVPSRLTADKPPVGDAVTQNSGLSSVAVRLSGTDRGPVMLSQFRTGFCGLQGDPELHSKRRLYPGVTCRV